MDVVVEYLDKPWNAIRRGKNGGGLSHAVLVAREYGIPACIGTREATKKIKTGDRIKVDGDMGAVYILEKAI